MNVYSQVHIKTQHSECRLIWCDWNMPVRLCLGSIEQHHLQADHSISGFKGQEAMPPELGPNKFQDRLSAVSRMQENLLHSFISPQNVIAKTE